MLGDPVGEREPGRGVVELDEPGDRRLAREHDRRGVDGEDAGGGDRAPTRLEAPGARGAACRATRPATASSATQPAPPAPRCDRRAVGTGPTTIDHREARRPAAAAPAVAPSRRASSTSRPQPAQSASRPAGTNIQPTTRSMPASTEPELLGVVLAVLRRASRAPPRRRRGSRGTRCRRSRAPRRPSSSTFSRPAVVGGQRGDLVAVEAVEQVAQVEGPVADVEVGVGEVLVDERLAAAQRLDRVGGGGRDLHQPARAGVRGLVREPRLLVDDRRDQRRVEVEALGLLADDVLVPERQGDLADRLAEVEPADDQRPRRSPRTAADQERTAAPRPRAPARSAGSSSAADQSAIARDALPRAARAPPSLSTT